MHIDKPKKQYASIYRASGELIVRTLIWIVFIAIWAYLNKPQTGNFFAIEPGFPRVIGVSLIVVGTSLYGWSASTFAGAKKNAIGAPKSLLAMGPYIYVRNPIYLSIATISAGVSTLYGAWGVSGYQKTTRGIL